MIEYSASTTNLPYLKSTSFASNATNFTNTNNFELRINNATTRTSRLYKAGLWVKLKFLKKAEVFYRVTQRNGTSAITATIPDARFFWDASAWSNPTIYFQTSSLSNSINSSSVALMDHTTNDNGTTGAVAVSGATLFPGTNFAIQRTSALTLNDMSYYILKHTVTSGTTNVLGSGFVIIQAHD